MLSAILISYPDLFIETWSEIIDKNYLAAFSWTLLDSVVDIIASPPRLKYIRDVECVMKITNVSVCFSVILLYFL